MSKKKLFFIFLYFFVFCFDIFSQNNEFLVQYLAEINQIQSVSIDKNEHLFVGDIEGNLKKYDKNGQILLEYSPQKIATISYIDAWASLQILAFYQDWQEFILFDRFLNPKQTEKINNEKIGFMSAMCLSADGMLWIFDQNDMSLKKYNQITEQILIYTPLDLLLEPKEYDIKIIKEYQNFIFVIDKKSGILVFDNLGNFKRKINISDFQSISFLDDSIYILSNNQTLQISSLYKDENMSINLPKNYHWNYIIPTKKGYFGLTNQKLYWIELN
ncbi:MAG: hypothetical protein EAZ85_16145 [Bacteroidetes bacterium]|nr:MAG: hypothetical protein EAZ85_16145 [Bacteroidota bacterium]TAG85771.1 MAG: hypothetical protein EAZ20_14235 [Bacteroidota bacterium]